MEMTAMATPVLPQMEPLDAQARNDLLAALNGCAIHGAVLRAAIVEVAPEDCAWFTCRGGIAFALDLLDGAVLRLAAADTAHAMDVLERIEPLLRTLETALEIELEPDALEHGVPDHAARMLRVMPGSGTRLYLALPHDLGLAPRPARFTPDLLPHVPLAVAMTIAGPRLSPIEAADLGIGDLVLLGPGPLPAMLDAPGRARVRGRFDPRAATFAPDPAVTAAACEASEHEHSQAIEAERPSEPQIDPELRDGADDTLSALQEQSL